MNSPVPQAKPEKYISVIIPNYNKASTIGKCLEAVFSSKYKNFEVIVVDDHSQDSSVETIKRFPCRLICPREHSGASRARNIGALNSKGEILFFTDADCLLKEDTLSLINEAISTTTPDVIIGGTYTKIPYDRGFFSLFQSITINYWETKYIDSPDYIAAHAMIIDADTFRKSGGFPERFMPILEDIEFSHRLRRSGYKLIMNPDIQVQHIFNFSLGRSMQNALRKSMYWTMYSLENGDMLTDSGCSSTELKATVVSYFLSILFLTLWITLRNSLFLYILLLVLTSNIFINRRLLRVLYETGGILFGTLAFLYYTTLYSLSVGIGAAVGIIRFLLKKANPTLSKST